MTRISATLLVQPVEDGASGFVVILDESTGDEVVVPLLYAHLLADAVHHTALELQGVRIRPDRRGPTHE